jgi:hypothetical protein
MRFIIFLFVFICSQAFATVTLNQGPNNVSSRVVYSSTPVTTATPLTLFTSSRSGTRVTIFDSSGQTMQLIVTSGGGQVDVLIINPGGGDFSLTIPQNAVVKLQALSATATAGESDINFY